MRLARLTPDAIKEFETFLELARAEPTRLPPIELLTAVGSAEPVDPIIEVSPPIMETRLAVAVYLHSLVDKAAMTDIDKDAGLWAWLTLCLFDTVCPKNVKTGERKLRERAAYIAEPNNFQRYYRHLLLGPFLIYRVYRNAPERAMALLCKAPYIIDDIVGQLASRQEFVTNPAIVGLATALYFDPATKTTKRGAGGKGGGSPRRLADVLAQFDVTWDLYGMSVNEFLDILPREFKKFTTAKV